MSTDEDGKKLPPPAIEVSHGSSDEQSISVHQSVSVEDVRPQLTLPIAKRDKFHSDPALQREGSEPRLANAGVTFGDRAMIHEVPSFKNESKGGPNIFKIARATSNDSGTSSEMTGRSDPSRSPFLGGLLNILKKRSKPSQSSFTSKSSDEEEPEDDKFGIDRMTSEEMRDRYLEVFGSSTPAMLAHDSQSQHNVNPEFSMEKEEEKKKNKKGAFVGVFVPTCENMWGVLIFLRFYYIVGHAGVGQALAIVFVSFTVAFCTTMSLSATVSSGGVIAGGGPYHIISRAIGPYLGASVGLTYYLGITCLAVLESLGAVEALSVAYPGVVDSIGDVTNTLRVYGTCVIISLVSIVYIGINFVSKLGVVFILVVFLTLVMFYAGLFMAPHKEGMDPRITGLSSETLEHNFGPQYTETGIHFGSMLAVFFPCFTGILSGANRADILRDPPRNIRNGTFGAIIFSLFMYTSFMILWGAVADSCYLKSLPIDDCGSHRQFNMGDIPLAHMNDDFLDIDPKVEAERAALHNIEGLIANAGVPRMLRRLAGGVSGKVVDEIAWSPFENAAFLGIVFSSISQALQCFIVAPRLFQSIAKDNVIPKLKPFAALSKSGEPVMAMIFTCCVAILIGLMGSLDMVAPLLTMCFLVAYAMLNLACAMLSVLRPASWRPDGIHKARYRVMYILLGCIGFLFCLGIMFTVDPFWAIGILALASLMYLGINQFGARAEWGSGFSGLRYQSKNGILKIFD